jgi:hypothetical protein
LTCFERLFDTRGRGYQAQIRYTRLAKQHGATDGAPAWLTLEHVLAAGDVWQIGPWRHHVIESLVFIGQDQPPGVRVTIGTAAEVSQPGRIDANPFVAPS